MDRDAWGDDDPELDGERLSPELKAAMDERERTRLAAGAAGAAEGALAGAAETPESEQGLLVPPHDKIPLAPVGTTAGRWWLPFAGLVLVVAALIFVNWAGLPGWRAGAFVAGIPLLALAIAVEVVASRRLALRGVYVAAAAGIVLLGVARGVDVAPQSHGRLEAVLDEANLAFFTQTSSRRGGHGWCSPACPSVVRTYDGPTRTIDTTYLTVVSALAGQGLVPYKARTLSLAARAPTALEVPGHRTTTIIAVTDVGGKIRLTLVLRALQGRTAEPAAARTLTTVATP